ncbi:MAG: elongation factor G [Planctomycetota bacterium]|nr:MAG: elongation factor G [Planctomycetota bacterium]
MPKYSTDAIRNIAILGAGGSGKTTIVEAMLHEAGEIGRTGRVEDGNTVCDFEDLEREMHHSLDSALVHLDYEGAHFNVLDTPGVADFLGRALTVLPAVETAVIVIDASAGIETVTRRVMRAAEEANRPRMIIVNKIDNASGFGELLAAIQETFGSECRPINLPADGGKAVIDCFEGKQGASDLGDIAEFHTGIVDQVVETDDALMEQYLEQGEVSPEQLRGPFKKAMGNGHLIPVCFVSARESVGIKDFMQIVAILCPNPADAEPPVIEYGPAGERTSVALECDGSKPAIAHVFRVTSDPYIGKLCVFRVHQGEIAAGHQILIDDASRPVRIAHVFKLQGKSHADADTIITGDIGAVAKVEELSFNSIMHAEAIGDDIRMKITPPPRPMFGLAIEGTSKGAETKIGEALTKLVAEDPTLQIERVRTTGETIMRGLGEQHLRMKLRLLKDRYGVEVSTQPPRVAYKETITTKAEGHHRHKKQSGGSGQFGEVYLRVEPISHTGAEDEVEAINGLVFEDATFGGSIPKQFIPAVEKGIRRVMHEGAIAGYPLQDVKVSVFDGKHHPVDSKEIAFMTAGRKAFVDAVQKAKPVLLEPFVTLEITVPAEMIGDISSDISGRRGRIQGTDMLPGNQALITAEAPLSEVMNYASQLKSISGGAGSYTMEYSHDERTPPNVQAEVIKAFKPKEEE